MGAPVPLAEYFLNDSIAYLNEVAGRTASCLEGTIPVSSKGKVPLIFTEPIGPVLALAPWNAASILSMRSVATPLAAGCPVVFKSSDKSPASHWLTLKCFAEAGLPAGTFNFLNTAPEASPEVVRALVGSPYIRKVNFTGSTKVGREIAVMAAQHLKPIVLELGGKSPCIVDANLPSELASQAAENVLFSAWHANGQICMSTERIYVIKEFYEEFLNLLASKAGNGPLLHVEGGHPHCSKLAVNNVNGLIQDAVSKGAKLVAGKLDSKAFESCGDGGAFINKTILAGVTPDMAIFEQESFGPVACIYPIDSLAEAVSLANASDYGLSASVWTSDLAKGIAVGRALHSGAVHLNGSVSMLSNMLTLSNDPNRLFMTNQLSHMEV